MIFQDTSLASSFKESSLLITDPLVDIRGVSPNCSSLSDYDWQRLVSDFQEADTDGDWIVSRDEISAVVSSEDELNWVFNQYDINGDDGITPDELCFGKINYNWRNDTSDNSSSDSDIDPRYANGNCSLLNDDYWS